MISYEEFISDIEGIDPLEYSMIQSLFSKSTDNSWCGNLNLVCEGPNALGRFLKSMVFHASRKDIQTSVLYFLSKNNEKEDEYMTNMLDYVTNSANKGKGYYVSERLVGDQVYSPLVKLSCDGYTTAGGEKGIQGILQGGDVFEDFSEENINIMIISNSFNFESKSDLKRAAKNNTSSSASFVLNV